MATLRRITDHLDHNGVQMIQYPFYMYGEPSKETIIAKIDLVESEDNTGSYECFDCGYIGEKEEFMLEKNYAQNVRV